MKSFNSAKYLRFLLPRAPSAPFYLAPRVQPTRPEPASRFHRI
jgi:hypothetical protein